ncbi:Uncharacterised protein [Mycobacteroides abscessus subsp. abscessus]|nr:Uncharacterised protein [Mycobacteroides abscessus subsp. abscessus]
MEPLATTSDARLEASPNPPAKGNISPARITAATSPQPASFARVTEGGIWGDSRSGIGTGYVASPEVSAG